MTREHPQVRSAVIVGAGIAGLSTAWHLQRYGVDVTVVDKGQIGSGASWGNAGWLTPGLVTPLADPGAWRHVLAAMTDPNAALHIPARIDPNLWNFLLRFGRNMTQTRWAKTMNALQPITRIALDAFDAMARGGITSPVTEAPYSLGFSSRKAGAHYETELTHLRRIGQHLDFKVLDSPTDVPHFSENIAHAIQVNGQSYLDPGHFVAALARSVQEQGGRIIEGWNVKEAHDDHVAARVRSTSGEALTADAVVLSTGAWMPALGHRFGLRTAIQSGRGYSFTVDANIVPEGPLYFPLQRVVGTPYQGALRIAGTMEFKNPNEALDQARIEAIRNAVEPLLRGIDWSSARDSWVGSRPVTSDGLPIIGQLRSPRFFASGGHGMWGIVLGPASGQLLAELITSGRTRPEIQAFDPLR